jgi:peptidoglycan/LPS O-acetylase OafA/YrhL
VTQQRARPFFPDLDALRFLCFFGVFLYHAFPTTSTSVAQSPAYVWMRRAFRYADIEISGFFVLSGFLITYLLLVEKNSGTIRVGAFYLRRILRVWPLYFACVIIGFAGYPLVKGLLGIPAKESANPWYYAAFLGNFDLLRNGLPDAGILAVLWSVSIEEQFYLVWPLLLLLTPRGREPVVFLTIVVASFAFRTLNPGHWLRTFHTFAVVGDMAIGGLAAYATLYSGSIREKFARLHPVASCAIYLATLGQLAVDLNVLGAWGRLIPATLFALLILEQSYAERSPIKLRRSAVLAYLGQRAYGMYCLHIPAIVLSLLISRMVGFEETLWKVLVITPALALGLTVAASILSFRYFEAPFLRLKKRLS